MCFSTGHSPLLYKIIHPPKVILVGETHKTITVYAAVGIQVNCDILHLKEENDHKYISTSVLNCFAQMNVVH